MKLTSPVRGKLKYAPEGIISQFFNDPNTKGDSLKFYQSLGLINHNGIDFWGTRGTPIYASHSGKVVYASDGGGTGGKGIKLQGDGFYTLYFHNDELLVSEGENVVAGQIIAKMGNSGSTPQFYMGVHLHFGLYEYEDNIFNKVKNYTNGFHGAIDPLPFITQNIMQYFIIGTEQYLYYEPLKMALNIGNEEVLRNLQVDGLTGTPEVRESLPTGAKVYPLVNKEILADIFGI